MGNTFSQQPGPSIERYTPAPRFETNPHLCAYTNSEGRVFVGKQLELPYGNYHQVIEHSLRSKRQNMDYHILPISDFILRPNITFCSEQEKCLILCQQPQISLEQLYQHKRVNNQRFALDELISIIDRTAIAMRRIGTFQERINNLNMFLIVFRGKDSYLVDPLIIKEEMLGNGPMTGRHPAPELLQWNTNLDSSIDVLSVHLFSLGIIALALCYLYFNIDQLYTNRSNSLYGRRELNHQLLAHLINQITHSELKQRISILTTLRPLARGNIFKIINRNNSMTQSTVSQSLTPTRNSRVLKQSTVMNSKPVQQRQQQQSRQKRQTERAVYRSVPVQSRNTVQRQIAEKQKTLKISQIPNQNISFKLLNPPQIQPQQQSDIPVLKVSTPKNFPNKKNISSQSNKNMQTKPSSAFLSITPKKPIVKQQFSTIKEVTEYEQDFSEHKLSQFKSSLNFEPVYEGNQVDGKKEGYGVCYFPQGSRYEGEWKNDHMHGYGKLFYSDGGLAYEGQWRNNQFHGNGKVYCLKPQLINTPFDFRDFNTIEEEWVSYEGGLVTDRKHGWGILTLSNGERYEGQFNNDLLEGQGTFFRMNGCKITGIWKDGRLTVGEI